MQSSFLGYVAYSLSQSANSWGIQRKGLGEPEPLCLAFFHLPSPAYSTTISPWSASSEHRDLAWFPDHGFHTDI